MLVIHYAVPGSILRVIMQVNLPEQADLPPLPQDMLVGTVSAEFSKSVCR